MTKEIVISEQENIAATFENGKISEFFMNEGEQLVGDIILGKVDSTIQSIDAAFVSIGKNRNGFIHITDLCVKNAKRKTGIKNHLQPKQNILVQIAKEATGSKGPRLTGMLTIPGKYMVLTPYERKVGISKKITDSFERDRLVYIAKNICQSGYGIIVRTEAIGQSEAALKEDLDFLLKRWSEILKMSETMNAPAVLYRDQDLLYRVLRDAVTPDVDKIVVDSPEARARAVDLLQSWSHNAFRLVQQNRSPIPLSHQYNVFSEIEKVLQPKAPLPSGGYLVIEKTEALTVIDVNSGSTKGTSGLSETILQTNKEAAVEIARQLKLRDIGGVIVIDFIDMLDQREQQIVWQILANAVKNDKAQPQLGYFSEFSLLEMTRHRQKKSITELLTTKCPYCDGIGSLRNNVYRSDLLTTESVRKRVNRFDDHDHGNNNKGASNEGNSKKMEELTYNVDYVENRMDRVPNHIHKQRKENGSSNQITYPKFDRNNNKYDDNLTVEDTKDDSEDTNDIEVVEVADNVPVIEPNSYVQEVYESVAAPEVSQTEENANPNENFVVELTKEERMYIESIEEPFGRKKHFKDKKFGKHKRDFQKRGDYNNNNNTNNNNRKFNNNYQGDKYNQRDRNFNEQPKNNELDSEQKENVFNQPHYNSEPVNSYSETVVETNHHQHNPDEVFYTDTVNVEPVEESVVTEATDTESGEVVISEVIKPAEEAVEAQMPSFIEEVVVIEEPVVVAPKKRGRKPAAKKSKYTEPVIETTVVETEPEITVEVSEPETVKEAESVSSSEIKEENNTSTAKPKKRGRIKSFSPKKRK